MLVTSWDPTGAGISANQECIVAEKEEDSIGLVIFKASAKVIAFH